MGSYYEGAKLWASLMLDKNNLKNDYTKPSSLDTYFKSLSVKITPKVRNVVIQTRAINADAFIIGHINQSILGTNKLGDTGAGTGAWGEWMRRRWDWNTMDRLSLGTYDSNVSITDGVITLQ